MDGSTGEVWTNADNAHDTASARGYGAQGIGLVRTEHMFFDPERLPIMRRMIITEVSSERRQALDELLPLQREDFKGLFREMNGLPVTIGLIDPPLHEFLPTSEDLATELKAVNETLSDSGTGPYRLH